METGVSSLITTPLGEPTDSRTKRLVKVARWIVIIAVIWLILGFLGVDLKGWISDLWDQITAIWEANPAYFIGALILQSGQTIFAGTSYYFILKAAYREEVRLLGDRDELRRRSGDERLAAGEHRHVRDAVHVRRDHPVLHARRGARRLHGAEDLLHDRRHVRLSVPLPERAGLVRRELREPHLALGADRDRRSVQSPRARRAGRAAKKRLAGMWENAKEGGVDPLDPEALHVARLPAVVRVVPVQARRGRDLPRRVRDPGHLRVDHVGRRLGLARERRLVHARARSE